MPRCKQCGEEFYQGLFDNNKLCPSCLAKKKLEQQGYSIEKWCGNCAFVDTQYKFVFRFLTGHLIENYYCAKFEMELNGNEAQKCTSFLLPEQYKEKALSGQLDTIITTCQYCGKKYDPKRHENCPKCGA